jgi:type II secretory ATPase GspE/PulE/Tfp pilus assembly ATPase PilB-like protein
MPLNDDLRRHVLSGASSGELREVAHRAGMRTLRENGITKVLEGVTTIEEMLRVVVVSEDEEG